jgi:hypothetical protein
LMRYNWKVVLQDNLESRKLILICYWRKNDSIFQN